MHGGAHPRTYAPHGAVRQYNTTVPYCTYGGLYGRTGVLLPTLVRCGLVFLPGGGVPDPNVPIASRALLCRKQDERVYITTSLPFSIFFEQATKVPTPSSTT